MRITGIYFLYRLAQFVAFPFLLLYFAGRGWKDARYLRRFAERLGWLPTCFRETTPGAIWLHAVSVGEALSAVDLLRRIQAELPGAIVYVSTTTLAGRAIAEEKLRGLADGIFYAPIDYCFAVRRVLRTLRPAAVVVLETEIWPNLYREAKRAGCALVVVNGRISDRAWPRYRALRWFFGPVLGLADTVLAQSDVSAARYLELGTPAGKVKPAGNLKYDFDPESARTPETLRRVMERAEPAEVWIAASTMPPAVPGDVDEDDVVIEAFRRLAPGHAALLLILAPRRPERFEAAAMKLEAAGVRFARRSGLSGQSELPLPGVLLLDSIGELRGLFGLADVVFMGGTLADRGGHNVLEPAFFRRPVIVGPHMENFPEIAAEFRDAGAWMETTAEELAGAVEALLADRARRARLGALAQRVAEKKRGATARAVEQILVHYGERVPRYVAPQPARLVLRLLAGAWQFGTAVKRKVDSARRVRLETPVISVGGLAMGGSGKTPFVLWLATRLKAAGHRPAILTRGYRRRSPERVTVLDAGADAPGELTGDEAQIFLHAAVGPVGIGADRAAAGRQVEQRFGPDVFLLDDGFQHGRMARDLDVVLVDTLDPLGGGVFPLGRLREPFSALARADIVVITRATPGRPLTGLEAEIRRWNTRAPLLRSSVAAGAWIEAETGARTAVTPPPFSRAAAFCGLANPASFWRTLDELGAATARRRSFPDHHRYTANELRELACEAQAARADALITTEKDIANLPAGWRSFIVPRRLYWLAIEVVVERAEELLDALERRIAVRASSSSSRIL